MVLDHRLSQQDPLSISGGKAEARMTDLLLSDKPVSLEVARDALNI
jgi:hypothetical protein